MTDITGYVNLALLVALIVYLLSVRTTMRRIAEALEKIAGTGPASAQNAPPPAR